MKYWPRYWQNTTRSSFWNSTFFVYYSIKHVSTYGPSWALMSSHKCSFWLISTHEHSWVWCFGAISAHESWLMPMAPWRHAHDCSLALMSAHWSVVPIFWVFMAAYECSWAIMSIYEPSVPQMHTHKQSREAMSANDCSWILMSSHEHSWAWHHEAMDTNQSSRAVMSMGSLGNGHSIALMSTYGAIAS